MPILLVQGFAQALREGLDNTKFCLHKPQCIPGGPDVQHLQGFVASISISYTSRCSGSADAT